MKSIYVVLSQTGTMFSRVLKLFTRAEYNHSSIAFDPTLTEMFSFGRLNPYNPIVGGFVKEGKDIGTFKRFYKTKAKVLELTITDEQYDGLKNYLEDVGQHKKEYGYNYLGVLCGIVKKDHAPEKRFYCSQFVRTCLAKFNIQNANDLPKVVKPIDFLKLSDYKVVYVGLLRDFKGV